MEIRVEDSGQSNHVLESPQERCSLGRMIGGRACIACVGRRAPGSDWHAHIHRSIRMFAA